MGGKREFRRCVSLMDDRQVKDHPRPPATTTTTTTTTATNHNHLIAFCPVIIHVQGCSDDEDDHSATQEANHVTKTANHKPRPARGPVTSTNGDPSACPPCPRRRSSSNLLEVPDSSHLSTLKATAVRLKLRTRTSSFLAWQAKYVDRPRSPPQLCVGGDGAGEGGRLTQERKERINQALHWLTTELREMQHVDQHLARQLLSLRHDIHQLRLSRSCQEHQELLDDVHSELQEQGELSELLDLPNTSLNHTPLQQIGVTRMNISARRFSTC